MDVAGAASAAEEDHTESSDGDVRSALDTSLDCNDYSFPLARVLSTLSLEDGRVEHNEPSDITRPRYSFQRDAAHGMMLAGKFTDALNILENISEQCEEHTLDTLLLMAECEFRTRDIVHYHLALENRLMKCHHISCDDLIAWANAIQESSCDRIVWLVLYKIAMDKKRCRTGLPLYAEWLLNFSRDLAAKGHETLLSLNSKNKFESFIDAIMTRILNSVKELRYEPFKILVEFQCTTGLLLCESIGRESEFIDKLHIHLFTLKEQQGRQYRGVHSFILLCLSYLNLCCGRSSPNNIVYYDQAKKWAKKGLEAATHTKDQAKTIQVLLLIDKEASSRQRNPSLVSIDFP